MKNYYEELVLETIRVRDDTRSLDDDHKADVVCLTLNALPPKYYRNSNDLNFYLDSKTRNEMKDKINVALDKAVSRINEELVFG